MSDRNIIGYAPIYEQQRDEFRSCAFMLCSRCNAVISTMGGPRHGLLCLACADAAGAAESDLVAARKRINELESKLTKQLLSEGRMLCRAQDAELALAEARARVAELEAENKQIELVDLRAERDELRRVLNDHLLSEAAETMRADALAAALAATGHLYHDDGEVRTCYEYDDDQEAWNEMARARNKCRAV